MWRCDPGDPGDPDDWFEEPDGASSQVDAESEQESPGAERALVTPDDDWTISGSTPAERGARRGALTLTRLRLWLVAGSLVLVLVIALAAAGVFSGGSPSPTPTATTARSAPQTPSKSPTTRAAPTASPGPTTTLAPGDSGRQVTLLQRALTRLGYSAGTADGKYGSKTKDAVARLQRAAGLATDGIFGTKTLAALTQRLGNA